MHKVLAEFLQDALNNPHVISDYYTHCTAHMIPKKGPLNKAKKYRPITCLPSVYKLLTSILAYKINNHLKIHNIMAWQQNGCKRKGRGCEELLVIDNMITKQARDSF